MASLTYERKPATTKCSSNRGIRISGACPDYECKIRRYLFIPGLIFRYGHVRDGVNERLGVYVEELGPPV